MFGPPLTVLADTCERCRMDSGGCCGPCIFTEYLLTCVCVEKTECMMEGRAQVRETGQDARHRDQS